MASRRKKRRAEKFGKFVLYEFKKALDNYLINLDKTGFYLINRGLHRR